MEIILEGIYLYSVHERNELIGLGRLCIHSLKFPTGQQFSKSIRWAVGAFVFGSVRKRQHFNPSSYCVSNWEAELPPTKIVASGNGESISKSSTTLESSNYTAQYVKVDVCIHLLQACGSVFRKAEPLSNYYVSISCGSEEILCSVRLIWFHLATSKRRDDDRMIGYLKKIVLLQPFGMPFTADATKQNGDPRYYKTRGADIGDAISAQRTA
ncbi:hypothetical protein GQ600_23452 [Phytophthora cactorum]|nr:hypothetical protein GQ600_23452 [Phytophthora cactorum]